MCAIGEYQKVLDVPESKPIRAFRKWGITATGQITPLFKTWLLSEWLPGRSMVSIRPKRNNTTGFWAFKTRKDVTRRYGNAPGRVGPVRLWGRVVVCQTGYRAEFAKLSRSTAVAKYAAALKKKPKAKK